MPSFTEGTWEYLPESGLIVVQAEKLEDDTQIAFVSGAGGFKPSQEGKANARLIANAPEMYKMLRAIEYDLHCIPHRLANDISGLLSRIDGEDENNA